MDRPPHSHVPPSDEWSLPEQPGFDYREFLHFALEKSWILVLGIVLSALIGVFLVYHTPKLYQSRLVLEVDVQQERIAPVEEVRTLNIQTLEQFRTIEQNLKARSLMERVARSLDLVHSRDFLPPSEDGKPYSEGTVVSALVGAVSPVVRRGTRLIDVTVTHTDAHVAQMIADAVGVEYIRQSIEKRGINARVAYDFLLQESERLKKKLSDSENALQAYREANGNVAFDEREAVVESKLRELNSRATEAKGARMRLENDFNQIDKYRDDPSQLLTIPSIANHPTVTEIKNQITQTNAGIAALAQRYKDKHPKMIQARSQLAELNKNLREAVLRLPPLLKSEYETSVSAEKSLGDAVTEQQKVALDLSKQSIPYNALRREVDVNKNLLESVLKRLSETDLTKGIQSDPVQIQESATYSPVPIGSSSTRTMALAIGGGLLAALALIAMLSYLDRSLKTVDQTEQHTGLPVLGAIPDMRSTAQAGYRIMLDDKRSVAAEAFRTLRASLELTGARETLQVTLFTSAIPSEGKSFTCTNYAVSLAQQGYRTLLIDADLRRPTLHKIFGIPPRQLGVTDFLAGHADLQAASVATEVENLRVMPGGHLAPNPAEILSDNHFLNVIRAATKEYDRVVVDTAPVIAVSDTLLMATNLPTICLVVRARKTPRNAVKRAITLLAQSNHRPVGLVLNRLPRKSGVSYYYYYSEHGYGDGAYGASDSPAEQVAQIRKAPVAPKA